MSGGNIAFTINHTTYNIDVESFLLSIIENAYKNAQKALQKELSNSLCSYLLNQKKKKNMVAIRTHIIPEFSHQFNRILNHYTILNSPDLYFENLPEAHKSFMVALFDEKLYGGML